MADVAALGTGGRARDGPVPKRDRRDRKARREEGTARDRLRRPERLPAAARAVAHAQRSFVVTTSNSLGFSQHNVRVCQGKKSSAQQEELDLFFHRGNVSSSVSMLKLVDLCFDAEVNGTAIAWVIHRRCIYTS